MEDTALSEDECCCACTLVKYVFMALIGYGTYWLYTFFHIDGLDRMRQMFIDIFTRRRPLFTALFKVDEASKENGGQLVASVLKAHNVEEVFTLCGGHISPILTSCETLGIRVIDTRHEVNAVFAADAVARLRQTIGVAAVTSGPGITNSITALKNAQMAESPVLLLGGGSPTLLKGSGALQDIDQMSLVKPICKFAAQIKRVGDIVPTLRKAIQIALSGTPGPVFVEFPIDVLYPYEAVLKEAGLSKNPRGLRYFVDQFVFGYISWQFGDAFSPTDVTPLPIEVPKPKPTDIAKAATLIAASKRPLILLGSQATTLPVSPSDTADIIETLKIPAYLSGMSRGLLGTKSSLQLRHCRRDAIRDADLIILAGTVCDFRLSYGKNFPSSAKIIAINRSKEQLTKNHKIFWNGEVLMQADVGFSLFEILRSLQQIGYEGAPPEWMSELRERNDVKDAEIARKCEEPTCDGYMNPLKALSVLDKALPDDAIYIADGGDFVSSAAYIARPRGPLKWLDPGAFGTLGVGGGFALGVKAVFPDAPVVIIFGDGSCGFSIMEFDSYVRQKLPVITVIGNDACWTQIARDQIPRFNSNVACDLAYTRYDQVGVGLGARGAFIDKTADAEQLRAAIADALAAEKRGESTVINVLIGKTDFRKGSISI